MHLFVSFILKAVAVFIKDVVLYDVGETENCQSSVRALYTPPTPPSLRAVEHSRLIRQYVGFISKAAQFIVFRPCIIKGPALRRSS